jgi:hypothetical protein
MRLAFLIPFRTDNGHRQQLYDWTTRRIKFLMPGSNIYTSPGPDGEFNRSAAINEAYQQCGDEDVVIINDADTIWNASSIISGVSSLVREGRLIIPYTRYNILNKPSTESILKDEPNVELIGSNYDCDIIIEPNRAVYHAPPVSGVVMLRSVDFSTIGGFDDRFVGWGEEDVAFIIKASKTLGRPVRCPNDVWHLWHPRGSDYSQPHYKQNQSILKKDYL